MLLYSVIVFTQLYILWTIIDHLYYPVPDAEQHAVHLCFRLCRELTLKRAIPCSLLIPQFDLCYVNLLYVKTRSYYIPPRNDPEQDVDVELVQHCRTMVNIMPAAASMDRYSLSATSAEASMIISLLRDLGV